MGSRSGPRISSLEVTVGMLALQGGTHSAEPAGPPGKYPPGHPAPALAAYPWGRYMACPVRDCTLYICQKGTFACRTQRRVSGRPFDWIGWPHAWHQSALWEGMRARCSVRILGTYGGGKILMFPSTLH